MTKRHERYLLESQGNRTAKGVDHLRSIEVKMIEGGEIKKVGKARKGVDIIREDI
jgi:hypothetical protein